jgi:hypothetical protein
MNLPPPPGNGERSAMHVSFFGDGSVCPTGTTPGLGGFPSVPHAFGTVIFVVKNG